MSLLERTGGGQKGHLPFGPRECAPDLGGAQSGGDCLFTAGGQSRRATCGRCRRSWCPAAAPGYGGVRRGLGSQQVRSHGLEGVRGALEGGGVTGHQGGGVSGSSPHGLPLDAGCELGQAFNGNFGMSQSGQVVECGGFSYLVAQPGSQSRRLLLVHPSAAQVACCRSDPGSRAQQVRLYPMVGR